MTIRPSKTLILTLAVAAAATLTAVYLLKDDSARLLGRAIETRGGHVLGTRVSVADVDVDRDRGMISLTGLAVANPGGFSKREMIRIGKTAIQGDFGERLIKRIALHGVRVTIELQGTRTNVESLDRRIAVAESATEPPSASGGAGESGSDGRKESRKSGEESGSDEWRVERIDLGNIRVLVRADWTPKVLRLKTDDLTVESLDAGTDDLVRAVATRLLDKVLVAAARSADNARLRKVLMDKVEALRARTGKPAKSESKHKDDSG